MDNLAVHHSKKFTNWLEKHESKIKAFYLPYYSPELNPDLKTYFHRGAGIRNNKELKNKIVSFLEKLQKQPRRIKNYFTQTMSDMLPDCLFIARINSIK